MTALESTLRKHLERTVVRARDTAEEGAAAVLQTLAVREREAHPTMDQARRDLRKALRAKAKNLGEGDREAGYSPLIEEIAYEQWHRLLFARFLAENGLLMYAPGMPVSLAECAELATEEGADNGWDLAGRYAARMLPGIFRAEDPAAQVRLAREHRAALEGLVADLPRAVFTSDDGLGWTYQFWQAKRKNEVNASGVKIGARELAPVTQLFTEDYMVRFLLENSLGAWWAARHPDSPLLAEMAYLRFANDGTPAAGTFPCWPRTAAEVTVMDPCCGSGHFLTRAFHLLREMRMEEEGLDPAAAGDAVLRDNLFGLELDERCVQITIFALALEAWKFGGFRALPTSQVACCGISVAGQLEEWLSFAREDVNLRTTLQELHRLFVNASSLGSLIDPKRVAKSQGLFSPNWKYVEEALDHLKSPNTYVTVADSIGQAAQAAHLLTRTYVLTATNPPFLGRKWQSEELLAFCAKEHDSARADLATVFVDRCVGLTTTGGCIAIVSPHNWLFLGSYEKFRREIVESLTISSITRLGAGAFDTITGEVVKVSLLTIVKTPPCDQARFISFDASAGQSALAKSTYLRSASVTSLSQSGQLLNPGARILTQEGSAGTRLENHAVALQGTTTGDNPQLVRYFWEIPAISPNWSRFQGSTLGEGIFGGRSQVVSWNSRRRTPHTLEGAAAKGMAAFGKPGIAVDRMGSLAASFYNGDPFDMSVTVIVPKSNAELLAIWAFASSTEFEREVRKLDQKLNVTTSTVLQVPFDLERWQRVAAEHYPDGLPEPHSDDPTQWLFKGHPRGSEAPLQVAVARLLGYRWPEQPEADGLEGFADADGIVPLAPVRGESPAADRLRNLLAAAYGAEWSPAVQERLLAEVGFAGKGLAAWLADGKGFFAQHAKLFHNRPFIWQIWDGARDGFSVLVNSHLLTRGNLEKLIYTYLGDWITRQEQARDAGDATAETRLIKARELKAKLEAILAGEPPYDVYVRWKPLHEQPIGWDPDLNDGVRLNIRPFVEAGVLRAKFSANWNKDRGDNPPGSTVRQYAAEAQQAATNSKDFPTTDGRERFNDQHLTRAVKEAARAAHRAALVTGGEG